MTSSRDKRETSISVVEEIKRMLSIEDVLNQYGGLDLKINRSSNRKSINIKCPFHSDRSPSFCIWIKTNTWKCMAGCGNGDVINLASKFLNITNKEAILMLKKQLGIENKLSATEYSNWKDDRNICHGFVEIKEQIIKELLHRRDLYQEVMKQVDSFEDIDNLIEIYHFKPRIEKYLEELKSDDIKIQIATVKYLQPVFTRGD
jgi:DNA primase